MIASIVYVGTTFVGEVLIVYSADFELWFLKKCSKTDANMSRIFLTDAGIVFFATLHIESFMKLESVNQRPGI